MSEIKELPTVTVHSDEGFAVEWNPETHDDWKVDIGDGKAMFHVRPKGEGLKPKSEDSAQ